MSNYIAHRRRKTSNALDTLVLSEQECFQWTYERFVTTRYKTFTHLFGSRCRYLYKFGREVGYYPRLNWRRRFCSNQFMGFDYAKGKTRCFRLTTVDLFRCSLPDKTYAAAVRVRRYGPPHQLRRVSDSGNVRRLRTTRKQRKVFRAGNVGRQLPL